MKSDADIQRSIESEFQWDRSLDSRRIGVIVHNGLVALSGRVVSYAERWTAEEIAACVSGVRGISNEIRVDPLAPASTPEWGSAGHVTE